LALKKEFFEVDEFSRADESTIDETVKIPFRIE
jgi:hypothetical protein